MPVIPLLASHIKVTFCRAVVEISYSFFRAALQLDIERNMLVQGICLLRIVSHRISGSHVHIFFCFIDLAAFFTKSVKIIVILDLAGMNAAPVGILAVRKLRNICMKHGSFCIIDTDAEWIFFHFKAELLSGNHCPGLTIHQCRFRHGNPLPVILHQFICAGFPRGCYQTVGRFIPVSVKARPDTDDIIRKEPYTNLHCVCSNRIIMILCCDSTCFVTYFHEFSSFGFVTLFLIVYIRFIQICFPSVIILQNLGVNNYTDFVQNRTFFYISCTCCVFAL